MWLQRFDNGTLRIEGKYTKRIEVQVDRFRLQMGPGPIRISLMFQGGRSGFISKLFVDDAQLRWCDADRHSEGARWGWQDGLAVLDSDPVGKVEGRKGHLIEAMLEQLCDVNVEVRVVPTDEVRIRSKGGLTLNVPAGMVVTAVGGTSGEPEELTLCRPMVFGFGGQGVELAVHRFRRLSRLMSVRVQRVTLHPNGRVELAGRGMRGMGLAVRRGLETTGELLSEVVRESRHFSVVRPFLVMP
jgi:hypothetical protein